MNWEVVIGLETHAQLSTRSKIFSDASTAFGAAPNTQASVVDLALPGVLPVLNKGAVERAIRFGLAVGATINRRSIFARKNYFYPDFPKGYQISQYEIPIVRGGEIPIVSPTRGNIKVQLTRAHLEEDAGKSIHGEALSGVAGYAAAGYAHADQPLNDGTLDLTKVSGIDLNRAGTPLLEIVSEPEMRSAEEAVAYAKALHSLVRWIGICDGNMQEGSFRCDANVSVRRPGAPLGTRREIKNLNSFRFLQQAIEYEIKWQIETLEDGGKIQQATVLFDPDKGETRMMRTKEDAHDYRYFPDPDLLPLEVSEAWIEDVRSKLPELPQARRKRFVDVLLLPDYDAAILTSSRELASYFEQTIDALRKLVPLREFVKHGEVGGSEKRPEELIHKDAVEHVGEAVAHKVCANWIIGEVLSKLNREGTDVSNSEVNSHQLAALLHRIGDGTISGKIAKEVLDAMFAGEGTADEIIGRKGLKQISDSGEIEKIVDAVIAANAQQVADYRSGKEKAFNGLVGQVMKASQGKANPTQVNAILKKKLG